LILEIRFGSIFTIYHSTPILCCTTGVGGEGRGCTWKRATKSFDLVKTRAKSLKIWAKLLKTFTKPLKILAKMAPNGAQKNMKSVFGGRRLFSGKFGKSRAKILRIPKNLPAPCCTTTD